MVCTRFLFFPLILCALFLPLNAFFKETNDIRDVIKAFRNIKNTPSVVIERLESALAKGKTTYSADEMTDLCQSAFFGVNDDDSDGEIGSCGAPSYQYGDEQEDEEQCEAEELFEELFDRQRQQEEQEELKELLTPSTAMLDTDDEYEQSVMKTFFPVDLPEESENEQEAEKEVEKDTEEQAEIVESPDEAQEAEVEEENIGVKEEL